MDFITGFGFTADVCGFASLIRNKSKKVDSDWNDFLDSIQKIINAVCKDYREFIKSCDDYMNIFFPEVYEELLYSSVLDALGNDAPFTLEMVFPYEKEFPDDEKKRLYILLKERLNLSFEYTLRSGQSEIINQLQVLKECTNYTIQILQKIVMNLNSIELKTEKIYDNTERILEVMDKQKPSESITNEIAATNEIANDAKTDVSKNNDREPLQQGTLNMMCNTSENMVVVQSATINGGVHFGRKQ